MKKIFLFILLFTHFAAFAQHHGGMQPDKPSTHGMLIFGREKIYASHLPLFHAPHNYQIILELKLDKAARQQFIKDQQLHPESATYTIEPEKFILPEMIAHPKPFKANLYRGHFERGGTRISDSIMVSVSAVVYFKKFNPEESGDSTSKFILFGNNKEQFAVHHISNKPDFEQIIQVKTNLPASHKIEIVNPFSNSPVGVSGNSVETADKTKIILLKQLYLEFEDLKE